MANIGSGTIRLVDDTGESMADSTSGALKIKIDESSSHPKGMTTMTSYDQFDAPTTVDQLSDLGSIGAQTDCKEIIIQADHDNTTFIMVGGSGTSATSTLRGLKIHGGETVVFAYAETADIYVDAPSSSQKLNVTILK